ncbi:MAG TPA: type II secretion system F family protein, partial [Coriobacteriia bacterium]|nr:type II secretion system F family protein [Coriobacteriia bacterium]
MATTTFKYNVRDKTGRVVSGKLEGESREAVATKLRQMGYIILDLDEDRLAQLNKIQFGTSVKTKDVTIFARQFATMINAGLSLTKCLSILADQAENKEMRDIIAQLNRDVEAGQSLSEAMMKHPKIFPPLFYNMVKAGETGGVL